jgi:hypothetical protein
MSKELDIEFGEKLFVEDPQEFARRGEAAATLVLSTIGGYESLIDRFPADRGDTNRAFILLCLKLAQAVEATRPELAEHFRSMAVSLGATNVEAGSRNRQVSSDELQKLLTALRDAWREVGSSAAADADLSSNPLAIDLAKTVSKLRVLFVYASPSDQEDLRLPRELRTIREAIQVAGKTDAIELDDLPAATIDDLRRALLKKEYEIIHFSGHADDTTIVLQSESGESTFVNTKELSELVKRHQSINCLILSACDSASQLSAPIAPFTIGMTETINDDAAIEFARGFYDAISHGKEIEFAVAEGESAAKLKGYGGLPIKLLKQ